MECGAVKLKEKRNKFSVFLTKYYKYYKDKNENEAM